VGIGQVYPPEWRRYADPQTGREVRQLTAAGNNYHLYYYNPSVTPDGHYLVFYSQRTGLNNLFRLDLASGEIVQLTEARDERAEYWPFTPPIRGLRACLACLGDGGQRVYYFEGNDLCAVHLETLERTHLLRLPADRRPSVLHADAGGATLVFATWDEALFYERSQRAYAGEKFSFYDPFFQETTSTIIRLDTRTGQAEEVVRMERFWINHVLVHPTQPHLILHTHELAGTPDRMWLKDMRSGAHGPVPGQGPDEWYMHEFWSADGSRLCFHGGWLGDETRGFAGWCDPAGQHYERFAHHTPGRGYGHYNLHPTELTMVTDGEAAPGCLSKVHCRDGQQRFEVLCRHDTLEPEEDQRAHPHPSFTPDGRHVVFTAAREQGSNVYLVGWEA
jgi:oligogalacturonide lyase